MINDTVIFQGVDYIVTQNEYGSMRLATTYGVGVQYPESHAYAAKFRTLDNDDECERVLSTIIKLPLAAAKLPVSKTTYLLEEPQVYYLRVKASHFIIPFDADDVFGTTRRATDLILDAMGVRHTELNRRAINNRLRVLTGVIVTQTRQQAELGLATYTSKEDRGDINTQATQIIRLVK